MAKQLYTETRIQGNEKPNLQITFDMLSGMIEVLDALDAARIEDADREREIDRHVLMAQVNFAGTVDKASPIRRAHRGWTRREQIRRPETAALPLCHFADYDEYNMVIPEHRAIMTPAQDLGEGIFAITKHLGEGLKTPKIFTTKQIMPFGTITPHGKLISNQPTYQSYLVGAKIITIESPMLQKTIKAMTGAEGLTNLEKIIYNEAGMTAQGDAVLPHEDHSQRPWYSNAGGIRKHFGCSIDEAERLALSFKIIGIRGEDLIVKKTKSGRNVPNMSSWIDKMEASRENFLAGLYWFEDLGKELSLVTDEGEPTIFTPYIEDPGSDYANDDEILVNGDNPADIEIVSADAWHKLDDPRDDAPRWEDKQPQIFKDVVENIRSCKKLADLKSIGKRLFNDKRFNKIQTTVIWGEYNRAKKRLEPILRPIAQKAKDRLTDPKVNLSKVAHWLYGEGKKILTAHEQSVLWADWKRLKKNIVTTKSEVIPFDESYVLSLYDEGIDCDMM